MIVKRIRDTFLLFLKAFSQVDLISRRNIDHAA